MTEAHITASGYVFQAHDRELLPNLKSKIRDLTKCTDAPSLADVRGTILLSTEGANVLLCGVSPSVARYKEELGKLHPSFFLVHYKDTFSREQTLPRMLVKIKKEIISMGGPSPAFSLCPAQYLSPKKLRDMLATGRDMILLDTRNDYECRLGSFKGAINLGIKTFRAFPEAVQKASCLDPVAVGNRPVVTFCTGGVRCEKAAFALADRGVQPSQLYQLKGGILHFLEVCKGGDRTFFEGDCYVFDRRVALKNDLSESETVMCFACRAPVTKTERTSPDYVYERSCPNCISKCVNKGRERSLAAGGEKAIDLDDCIRLSETQSP